MPTTNTADRETAKALTPKRLREIRETMQLPRSSLAAWSGIPADYLEDMEEGLDEIPAAFGEWFVAIGAYIEINPPPPKTGPKASWHSRFEPLSMLEPERMTAIRMSMHLPVKAMARWVERAEGNLRQMEMGPNSPHQRVIPRAFGDWFHALGEFLDANPSPPPPPPRPAPPPTGPKIAPPVAIRGGKQVLMLTERRWGVMEALYQEALPFGTVNAVGDRSMTAKLLESGFARIDESRGGEILRLTRLGRAAVEARRKQAKEEN